MNRFKLKNDDDKGEEEEGQIDETELILPPYISYNIKLDWHIRMIR